MKLIDRWTTQDGSWEPNDLPYSITRAAADKYGGEDIPGRGAANHIVVKVTPGAVVFVNTTDHRNPTHYVADVSGWINHPMAHSSAYVPARGEQGPWVVWVDGVEIARGIGLPDGLHVSTWLIAGERATEPGPGPQPPPNPITAREYLEWIEFYAAKAKELL